MIHKAKVALLVTILSALAAASSAAELVGHTARLVSVVTLFASGFGAGVGVMSAVAMMRQRRKEAAAENR